MCAFLGRCAAAAMRGGDAAAGLAGGCGHVVVRQDRDALLLPEANDGTATCACTHSFLAAASSSLSSAARELWCLTTMFDDVPAALGGCAGVVYERADGAADSATVSDTERGMCAAGAPVDI